MPSTSTASSSPAVSVRTATFSLPSRTTHASGTRGVQLASRPEISAARAISMRRRPTATAASAARVELLGVSPSNRSPNSAAMKSVDSAPALKRRWFMIAVRNATL